MAKHEKVYKLIGIIQEKAKNAIAKIKRFKRFRCSSGGKVCLSGENGVI